MFEETLDPKDWEEQRKLGHQIIDDMIEHLKTIRKKPVWQPIPSEVKDRAQKPIPKEGQKISAIYKEIKEMIIPYTLGNTHPCFWGWVVGTGTLFGAYGDFIASALNQPSGGLEHIANYVEHQVLEWVKEMLDYDPQASGLITRGASMASVVGLTVARNVKAGFNLREEGLQFGNSKVTYYCSTEGHSCLQKAIELLGVGNKNLRKIPVTKDFQIDLENLKKTINRDKRDGYKPICVIGNLGTVNTGAIDDLKALADIAKQHDMWFHIDGAFGALTRIAPKSYHLADGMELADSIAVDFHKWFHTNYAVGCVLVKSHKDHFDSFAVVPEYLAHGTRGVGGPEIWYSDYGFELSGEFKTLKIWMSMKEHGIEKFGQLVEQNIQQAKHLTELIEKEDKLELLAPTAMNIVCFRFKNEEMDLEILNKLNEEIVLQLQERGIAVPSHTRLNGKYAIRVAITNHRTKKEDLRTFIKAVKRIAQELEAIIH
ncbi:MAG: pyridoxal phosphate-dependent decarboxylase family protein [Promethearchaeota archaeon]